MSSSKTFIFDFDGTIADSFELNVDIFCKLKGRGLPTKAEIENLRQMQTLEVLRELRVSLWHIPGLLRQWRTAMRQRIGEVHPFPGIGDVLHQLHKRGHRLYILSTNSPKNIDAFLTTHGMRQFFTDICGDVGFFGKRRTIKQIMRRHNLPQHQCFYVGDETRDIKAGRHAGINVIAVTWGYAGEKALTALHPYALIHSPTELLSVGVQKQPAR